MKEQKSEEHPGNWCYPTQIRKSDILKRVDKIILHKQAGNWCQRIKTKQKVMREHILTPRAQRNLLHRHQSWKTWNARTIDTWVRSFSVLEKKLGMSATNATFSMVADKTNLMIWRMFLISLMKADIHLGPSYVSNSEIYKNTKFVDTESVFNITQKLVKEHSEKKSECEMLGVFITFFGEIGFSQ